MPRAWSNYLKITHGRILMHLLMRLFSSSTAQRIGAMQMECFLVDFCEISSLLGENTRKCPLLILLFLHILRASD